MTEPADKWIEVNLTAIEHNLDQIRGRLTETTRLIAVVKSNAYGLGAIEVTKHLAARGVDFFAVSFLHEALELRQNGITEDILVFCPLDEAGYHTAVENHLVVTVASPEDLQNLLTSMKNLEGTARVHLKVDTGIGRFGLVGEEAALIALEASASLRISLEGIYTHFALPSDQSYTRTQFSNFAAVLDRLKELGLEIECRHCCASASLLRYPNMHLDAVRIGTLLWGQFPGGKPNTLLQLQDCFVFKARVSAVRSLKRGNFIGYAKTYRLRRDARVAVIPVGLADGWGIEASSKPSGFTDLIKMMAKDAASYLNLDIAAPRITLMERQMMVRGKIFMQFCLAEVPPGVEVRNGDVAQIPVKRTLASPVLKRIYYYESEYPVLDISRDRQEM